MDRRKFIIGSGIAFTTALAGCAGDTDDTDDSNGNGDDDGNGESSDDNGNGSENGGDENGEESDTSTESSDSDDTEEVDEIEPQSFEGSGADVIDGVSIEGGLVVVDATHTGGERNFQVTLVDDSEFDEYFVNEIGEYEGETAELVDTGEYMLEVEADGDWEIDVLQPVAKDVDELPQSLSGEGNRVIGPIEFNGTHTAEGEHSGERNFQVSVYPEWGSFPEFVFNEIGEYEGTTTLNHDGAGWVAIEADGSWSVDLE